MHTPNNKYIPLFRPALAGLVTLLLTSTVLPATIPSPLPLEAFFAEPDMRSVQLSPDGKYLAALTTLGTGKVGIALMDLATGKWEALVATKDENIQSFFWKSSEYIVYSGDLGGNESPALRSINIGKRKVVALSESLTRYTENANWADLIDEMRFSPSRILIYGNKGVASGSYGYWFLDIRSGERSPIGSQEEKPDGVVSIVDTKGVIKARSYFRGDKIVYEVRDSIRSNFVKVAESPVNEPHWSFLEFAADDETLYLLSNEKTDTNTLHTLNVRTRELSPPVFHPSEGEIGNTIFSWDLSKFYGVSYVTDKRHYQWFDAGRAALQAKIDQTLPETSNYVVSTTQDEKLLVVAATSDREPGTYYLLDLRTPRLMFIGKYNHALNPSPLRPMEPIQFAARDGLVLHGYLTRPAGSEGKRVPLIINPHGGPYGPRDYWGYNSEVQFLANRGYAVLQINYRGSGGYGRTFEEAGKREWGGKMQDDLTDGVKWAIAQGITDADHVAIYGASYGGYAALAGATFTPDLYRCAANYVGVSDLSIITSWGRGRYGRGSDLFAKEWIGDDKQYKFDHSPVNFVDRIKIPIMNAYGFNDPRVDIDHWKRLESKLKQSGKTYEIIIEENEGHGFKNEAARMNFYRHLEAFFAKYLPLSCPN